MRPLALLLLLAACAGTSAPSDAGCACADASADAAIAAGDGAPAADALADDAAPDAAVDVAPDAAPDGAADARPDAGVEAARPAGELVISPMTQTFLGIPGSKSPAIKFLVPNVGDVPAPGLAVMLGGADAGDFVLESNGCAAPVPPMSTCAIAVAFQPRSVGNKSATLTVSSPTGGMAVAQLTGHALPEDKLRIDPERAGFQAAVGSASAPTTFTVRNISASATTPLEVSVTGTAFAVSADRCAAAVLPGGGTCTLSVVFKPAAAVSATELLMVKDPAGGAALAVLSGTPL